MRGLGLPLLILALGLGLWLFSSGDAPEDNPLESEPLEAPGDEPVLRASGRAATPREPEGAASSADAPPKRDDAHRASPHRLVGLITGLAVAEYPAAGIRVQTIGEHGWVSGSQIAVGGVPDTNGRYAIDLGALRKDEPEATHVQVTVDHPAYVIARARVRLAPPDAKETQAEEPIALVRAAIFEGLVLSPQGVPVAEARVAAYGLEGKAIAERGEDDDGKLDATETDASGAFRLRCPRADRALVASGDDGALPAGQIVDLTGEDQQEPLTLKLRAGERITGRVDFQGAGAANASIVAKRDLPGETYLEWINCSWFNGRVIATSAGATTNERGYFELTHLEPGPWSVSVGSLEGYSIWGSIRKATTQTLEAPSLDAHFVVGGAALILKTVSGSEPLKHVRIERTEASGVTGTLFSRDGRLALLIPANRPMTMTASEEHYASVTKEIPGLQIGTTTEVVFDLGPRKATAGLRVHVTDESGKPLRRAAFLLIPPEADPSDHLFDEPDHILESADGSYALEDLEPGLRQVVVTPGCGPDHLTGGYLRHTERVDLRPGEQAQFNVKAKRGGRVTVTVKDSAGGIMACNATLQGQGGRKIPVVWSWSTEDTASLASGGPGAAAADMQPVLAPGSYVLICTAAGHTEHRERFTVERGKHQHLTITLRKQ